MVGFRPGRWLLTLVGLFTSVGPWLADFNATHIYNDRWPPHAKFHTGQTILLGTLLGLLTLFYTWRRGGHQWGDLWSAVITASLYWVTQATAGLLPNTALADPEFVGPTRLPFGLTGPQPFMDVVVLGVIFAAFVLERRRRERNLGP